MLVDPTFSFSYFPQIARASDLHRDLLLSSKFSKQVRDFERRSDAFCIQRIAKCPRWDRVHLDTSKKYLIFIQMYDEGRGAKGIREWATRDTKGSISRESRGKIRGIRRMAGVIPIKLLRVSAILMSGYIFIFALPCLCLGRFIIIFFFV